ncbi:hypothetical protein [Nostoc sp.]|uniref:hypothetical protein n=1 Tax=Nostoc sp. TaxID=1180 RepID=UPI002FFD3AAA
MSPSRTRIKRSPRRFSVIPILKNNVTNRLLVETRFMSQRVAVRGSQSWRFPSIANPRTRRGVPTAVALGGNPQDRAASPL